MKKKFSLVAIFFVGGIVLAVTISTSAFREAYRSRMIEKEVDSLKQQALNIQKENDALTQRIAYLQTPEFQEKIAKEKLNLQKPDENVVIVKPEREQQSAVVPQPTKQIKEENNIPNYQKWWKLFFAYE